MELARHVLDLICYARSVRCVCGLLSCRVFIFKEIMFVHETVLSVLFCLYHVNQGGKMSETVLNFKKMESSLEVMTEKLPFRSYREYYFGDQWSLIIRCCYK